MPLPAVSFDQLITAVKAATPDPFVLQIGAMDGVRFDLLYPYLSKGGWRGLLVEPVPDMFEKLTGTYAGQSNLQLANCAVAQHQGTLKLRRVDPAAIAAKLIPEEALGITTMYADRGLLAHPKFSQLFPQVAQSYMREIEVPCETLPALLAQHHVERIDVVVIDTEGADWLIASQLDLEKYRPRLICLEHDSLSKSEFAECQAHFEGHGYQSALCQEDMQNILFFRP